MPSPTAPAVSPAFPPRLRHNLLQLGQQLEVDQLAAPDVSFAGWMATLGYVSELNPAMGAIRVFPARRLTIHWTDFKFYAARCWLILHHMPQYESLGRHDRHLYVQHVIDDFVMQDYLMHPFREAGFTE